MGLFRVILRRKKKSSVMYYLPPGAPQGTLSSYSLRSSETWGPRHIVRPSGLSRSGCAFPPESIIWRKTVAEKLTLFQSWHSPVLPCTHVFWGAWFRNSLASKASARVIIWKSNRKDVLSGLVLSAPHYFSLYWKESIDLVLHTGDDFW